MLHSILTTHGVATTTPGQFKLLNDQRNSLAKCCLSSCQKKNVVSGGLENHFRLKIDDGYHLLRNWTDRAGLRTAPNAKLPLCYTSRPPPPPPPASTAGPTRGLRRLSPRDNRPGDGEMLSSAAFSSSSSALLRGAPPRTRRLLLGAPARAHSGAASRARGGLPRFHAPSLPSSKVSVFVSPAPAVRP